MQVSYFVVNGDQDCVRWGLIRVTRRGNPTLSDFLSARGLLAPGTETGGYKGPNSGSPYFLLSFYPLTRASRTDHGVARRED